MLANDSEALGNGREIRVQKANVRAGPGKNFEVVTVAAKGLKLAEIARSGDWAQVGLVGTETIGWIHTSLIEARTHTFHSAAPGF